MKWYATLLHVVRSVFVFRGDGIEGLSNLLQTTAACVCVRVCEREKCGNARHEMPVHTAVPSNPKCILHLLSPAALARSKRTRAHFANVLNLNGTRNRLTNSLLKGRVSRPKHSCVTTISFTLCQTVLFFALFFLCFYSTCSSSKLIIFFSLTCCCCCLWLCLCLFLAGMRWVCCSCSCFNATN